MHIYINTSFEAYHRWKDAPDEVAFLREYHRHLFRVKLFFKVSHFNRDLEFFILKRKIDDYISDHFKGRYFELSCEGIAYRLCNEFRCERVVVSEDGENGAVCDAPQSLKGLKKECCFIGEEAEGPFRGARVLFVPGRCMVSDWDLRDYAVDRIYYGAGNDQSLSLRGLRECLSLGAHKGIPVDVESKYTFESFKETMLSAIPTPLSNQLGLYIELDGDPPTGTWDANLIIKWIDYQNESVLWKSKETLFTTWFRDPLFGMDVDLHRKE